MNTLLLPRDSWLDALDEAQQYRNATLVQRYEALAAACRAAFTILENHPRRAEFLAYQDPLPPETQALLAGWRRGR